MMMEKKSDGTRQISLRSDEDELGIEEFIPRILVVDDQENIRSMLQELLFANDYHQVDVACNSEEALDLLKTFKYNLILSDINLPGMSGMDLLKYIRKYFGSIEVILITGNPDLNDAVAAVKNGAFDYLSKPVDFEKLLAQVTMALRQQQVTEKRLASPAGIEVDEIHGYNIIRTLGCGSMGVVALVEKEGKYYAIKILRKDTAGAVNSQRIKRFLREAEVLAKIDHPCVVKVYDCFVSENNLAIPCYIVMEFVPGNPLSYYMNKDVLSLDNKLAIISQIAAALEVVHKHGILHRDIKPGNVIINKQWDAKLMDFGIARILDSSLTMTQELVGSPAYMAPECFGNRDNIDFRSDIFSLGVMGYELLTGQKPFNGDVLGELMAKICSFDPVEPMKLNPNIPAGAQDILAKMLVKDPGERFAKTGDIVRAINHYKIRIQDESRKPGSATAIILRDLLMKVQVWQ